MTFCFFPRAEQLCFDAHGRIFHRGKSVGKDTRSLIIDDILSRGGDVSTEVYPGRLRALGSKYKVSGVTVSNIRKTFCQTGENLPRHAAARGQPKRLEEPELDLVQLLIKRRPSITYKDIKENIEAYSTATASISFIGQAVRDHLPEGKMTLKKMMRPAGEKFFFYLVNKKYFSLSTVMLQIKTRVLKVGGLKLQFLWFYNFNYSNLDFTHTRRHVTYRYTRVSPVIWHLLG